MRMVFKRGIAVFIALCLAFLLCACESEEYTPVSVNGEMTVHFIDVGQADAALIVCDGKSMLIDGGNVQDSSRIVTYLKKQGISHLDYVVNTHAHEDHVGGLAGALNVCTVGKVLSSCESYDSKAFENFVKYAKARGASIEVPNPGDEFQLSEARVQVLAPLGEYEDENNNSIVVKITHGENSFLFTGDMEALAEEDLIESGANLSADVLKVAHHGSSSSSTYRFLREVMPEYAVISVGADNSYGHPHDESMSRLRDSGAKLYRTDIQGDIIARSDGKRITFNSSQNADVEVNTTVSSQEEVYIGNKKSKKFHDVYCTSLPSEKNRIEFSDRDSAVDAGYSPCGNCKP